MADEIKQMQDDEREALQSIYEGDVAFKESNPKTFQYKYGTEDEQHTFLVEIGWTENYPNELPTINMNVFYNQHLVQAVKTKIVAALTEEGEQWLGCGMTYTLFECLKDRIEEMMAEQPEAVANEPDASNEAEPDVSQLSLSSAKGPKKEQMTKAQKRRQWDHAAAGGEKPRGWDWVDIVRHLSQIGSKDERPPQN